MRGNDLQDRKKLLFTDRLLRWFEQHKRCFPWRPAISAYQIAVAEALLQKTSAANALLVYEKFLEQYPEVTSLAAASAEEIIELLRPLGLPRRAILLHHLAKMIVHQHNGKFPESEAELRKLPGIGPYGAAAIASQIFGQRAPMIDINVMRILSRVFSVPFKPRNAPSKALRTFVINLMPPSEVVEFNLALLDFGALVCRARDPKCKDCPLADICDYNLLQEQTQ